MAADRRAMSRSDTGIGHSETPPGDSGPREYQRDAERRVVCEDAVADLAVLAEGLTVIGSDNDQRACRSSASAWLWVPSE
jgi:hypothetical protein